MRALAAAGYRPLRDLGLGAAGRRVSPQPQLLALRRLPRHRRRRPRQAHRRRARRRSCAPRSPSSRATTSRAPRAGRRSAREEAVPPEAAAVRVHAERAAPDGRLRAREFEARTGLAARAARGADREAPCAAGSSSARPGGWRPTALGPRFLNDLQALFPATADADPGTSAPAGRGDLTTARLCRVGAGPLARLVHTATATFTKVCTNARLLSHHLKYTGRNRLFLKTFYRVISF